MLLLLHTCDYLKMSGPRSSLNPVHNSTPNTKSRRTIFGMVSFNENEPDLNFCRKSHSDLFVFGNDKLDKNKKNGADVMKINKVNPPQTFGSPVRKKQIKNVEFVINTDKKYNLPNFNSPYKKPSRSRLLQDLNSPSAFARVRALQAIKNPEQFESESDSEDEIATLLAQAPKPVKNLNEVLIGVTAYVEVCDNSENYSEGVKDMLRRMGAIVRDTFLKDVTHVIFKDGRVSTYKKAIARQLPILSMLWIEACKTQMYKVNENLYQASCLKEYETLALLQKRSKPIQWYPGRTKNLKKSSKVISNKKLSVGSDDSFGETSENIPLLKTVTNPASTLNKFRDNLKEAKETGTLENGGSSSSESSSVALMKKFISSRISANKNIVQTNHSINNKNTDQESDSSNISDLLAKISVSNFNTPTGENSEKESFNELGQTHSSESDSCKEKNLPQSHCNLDIDMNRITPIKKKPRVSFKPPMRQHEYKIMPSVTLASDKSTSSNADSNDSSLRLHISSTSEDSKSTHVTDESSINKNRTKSDSLATDEILQEINTAIGNVISDRRKSARLSTNIFLNTPPRKHCDDINRSVRLEQLTELSENSTSNLNKSLNKTNGLICEYDNETDTVEKIDETFYFEEPVSKEIGEIQPALVEEVSPKIVRKRKLFTMNSNNSIVNTSITNGDGINRRMTLDQYFNIGKAKTEAKKKIVKTKRVLQPKTDNGKGNKTIDKFLFANSNSATSQILTDSLLNNMSAVVPERRSTMEFQKQPTREELREKAQKKVAQKRLMNIVCTSLRSTQQDVIKRVIKALGVYHLCDNVTGSTSHVVSLEPRRTLTMLKGIVRGCWIVNFDWVLKSEQAGRWLEEDMFEWTTFAPAVQRARVERQAFGESYKMDIFSTCGLIYISKKCTPPWKELQDLVTYCSGKVVATYRIADIVIGESYNKQLCVSPNWILDSITNFKVKSVNDYVISEIE